MGHSLDSSFEMCVDIISTRLLALNTDFTLKNTSGGWKWIYASAVLYAMISSSVLHVLLSKLFPDHDSLIDEAVYAHEVLAARQGHTMEHHDSEVSSEKGKDEPHAFVATVV
jgi:NCS1 family nucleobase:cation symporter-1